MRQRRVRDWQTLSEGPITDYRVIGVQRISRRSPRTGEARDFVVVHAGTWVNVVALTEDEQVVLVHQYRHGTQEETQELPGGIVEPGEASVEAAARELLEETGYAGAPPVLIGSVAPNPAFLTNRCDTVLITGARRVAEPDQDPGEDIEVSTCALEDIPGRIASGQICHALVVAAFMHLHLWKAGEAKG